jgi:hypothetical protein
MKLTELFKFPSTKREEALEAKRLKEQAYIKAEEARLEHAAKQRQQMEQYYEETRKRREREYYLVADVPSYAYMQMTGSNVETKVVASNSIFVEDVKSVFAGNGGSFSGGGSSSQKSFSSHWTYDPPSNTLSETCSSSSDSSSSSCSSGD